MTRRMSGVLALFLGILFAPQTDAGTNGGYRYLSPRPGSALVSRETNIIIRHGDLIDPSLLTRPGLFSVVGSASGVHEFRAQLSDDGKTILLIPTEPFAPAEGVTVTIHGGGTTTLGNPLPVHTFTFTTTPLRERIHPSFIRDECDVAGERLLSDAPLNRNATADTLPSDFPAITIDTISTPAPGYLFMTVSDDVPGVGYYMMMLDNTGYPVLYKKTPQHYSTGFRVLPNGMLYYADIRESHFFAGGGQTVHKVMDWTMTDIDSFQCGNGYVADNHDFLLMPNGHAILFAYDPQPVDMSAIVAGGHPGAFVAGTIVQELDASRNVVFQWRSWDYIPITDSYMNLKSAAFDYIHVNSIDLDTDGNLLISSRQLCEVTKIDRETGEIIWRLGGKKNQFTFVGENAANAPTYFTHQHTTRKLPNGNLLIFDNGLLHSPPYSRAVEYAIDEQNKVATMVWEYRHTPDYYGSARGSAQRLPNGNTIIGWGTASQTGQRAVTEVRPDKSIVFELSFPLGVSSYNAYRFARADSAPAASVRLTDLAPGTDIEFREGDTVLTGVTIRFNSLSTGYNSVTVKRDAFGPLNPEFLTERAPRLYQSRFALSQTGIMSFVAEVSFDSSIIPKVANAAAAVVYRRDFEGRGMFFPEPTVYDPSTRRWTASVTQFGEFAIGADDVPMGLSAPTPVSPVNGALVNDQLPAGIRWAPRGQSNRFHLQVATDSVMTALLVDDSTLSASYFELSPLSTGQWYFWRARAVSDTGASDWTPVWKFLAAAPFLTMASPNGGERWQRGGTYFVKWDHNLAASVRLDLLQNGVSVRTIIDSLRNGGAYSWKIPADVAEDSTYSIRVSAVGDTTTADTSDGFFAIKQVVSGAEGQVEVPLTFSLEQNYPNPFNPSTEIRFSVAVPSMVALRVFDVLGREVAVVWEGPAGAGVHEAMFHAPRHASGMYLYEMRAVPLHRNGAGEFVARRRMMLLR